MEKKVITLPADDLLKQEALHKVARNFEMNKLYSEGEVNEIIKSCNAEDCALFRRELVNFNYLGKDAYKGIYWLKTNKLSREELEKIRANQDKMRKGNVY